MPGIFIFLEHKFIILYIKLHAMFLKDELPILGILRGIKQEHIDPIVSMLSNEGIRYVEVTMNTQGANELIKELIRKSDGNFTVGAGTVLHNKDLEEALNAGAKFIVTPSVVEDVIQNCVQEKIPVFPGALTPTEVYKAWDMGATMVKLFPSGVYGPGYIRALKGPFDDIKIMAVGGVSEKNIAQYFLQGASAVAFGAGIFRPEWLQNNHFDFIEDKLKLLIKAYKATDGI